MNKLLSIAALLAATALPLAASAQQAPYPVPVQAGQQNPGTPRAYAHWMRVLQGLNGLTGQQQQQLQGILTQYVQTHPQGSPRDPNAKRALRDQIYGVLTPAQQSQLKQEMRAMHQQRMQRRMQRQQMMQQQQQRPPSR